MRAWLFVLLLAGCDRTVPTPAETTLLTLPAIGTESGPSTHHDIRKRFRGPDIGENVELRITFDSGPPDAIRNFRIFLVRNTRWAVSVRCSVEPPTKPPFAKLWCPFTLTRKNGTVKIEALFQIDSDGSVTTTRDNDWDVE